MLTKQLGNSDINITSLGLGAWAIGGNGWEFGWGAQDDKESIKAIHRALEHNVNWIDTAAAYGMGHSEEVVAKALETWTGETPYIFTKCGLRWDNNGNVFKNIQAESIQEECEDSLRRLKVDVIDLYQIHWPPESDNSQIDEAWDMMLTLQQQEKVRWIGVSNFNVEQLNLAKKIAPTTSLQPPYSLINREVEKEIFPYCLSENIGVIVYSPMGSGLLTGKMTRERILNLPADDWRKKSPDFNEAKLSKNLLLVEKLKEIGKRYNRTPGEVAIAWTLNHPAVTGAIVGARSAEQVDGVFSAHTLTFTEEEIKEIEAIKI
ncbi:MAG: aldo/keto reductase [Ignavibacteriaceae bacterium]